MDFQEYIDITHVKDPSLTKIHLNNVFCVHDIGMEGYMIRKTRLHL
jgi:hypothetical protein